MPSDFAHTPDYISIGRIGKSYGVHGWVHVHSSCDPADNILLYTQWMVKKKSEWVSLNVTDCKRHHTGFIAKLEAIHSPEQAKSWANKEIAIEAKQLPTLDQGEFYRHDLIGLQVTTTEDDVLGTVVEIIETGANDVFVIEGQSRHLIPYIDSAVIQIDPDNQSIIVDWDPSYDE